MNYLLKILAVILFLSSCSNSVEQSKEEIGIHVILQDKTAYLNGKIHGSSLREEIREQVENWLEGIEVHIGLTRDSAVAIVHQHTGFLGAIRMYTPNLLDEINGIADGAGIGRELLLCYNLGEEIYNFCKTKFEACSNMAYLGERENILAYNQDLPQFLRGREQPVVLKHDGYYIFTMPGSIALSAVSSDMAVSCNSLPMLRMNKEGLPLAFFIRQLIRYTSLEEAKLFIENTPLAVPQNILIISAEGMLNAEISQNNISLMDSLTESSFYHTNFPLTNRDYKYDDYIDPHCGRFHFLDSLNDNIKKHPEVKVGDVMERAFETSPLNNAETYLRYMISYREDQKPKLTLINPKRGAKIDLDFRRLDDQKIVE